MKKFIILFSLLLFISCNKKEVQLPNIPLNGKEEIHNHSSIWLFNDNGKVDLNQKNRISSTHWFFNIDKSLVIGDILPMVIKLRIKHNEKSPHNTKIMDNYFSYANSLNDKLSFYRFDSIQFKNIKTKELPVFNKDSDTVLVYKKPSKKLIIPNNIKVVQLAYAKEVTFQEYLFTKTLFKDSKIATVEFIVE